MVAITDPSYGRAITVANLEPDYNEELKRFVPLEEIRSYVLAEEELYKIPSFFKQSIAVVQVAAANDQGQSPWAALRVRL